MCDDAAALIQHFVGQAAGLVAVTPVGAAASVGMGDVALARIRNAQRAVDEVFDGGTGVDGLVHGLDLLQVQLPRQHDLAQTRVLQKTGFFGCADIVLCGGMQLDGG